MVDAVKLGRHDCSRPQMVVVGGKDVVEMDAAVTVEENERVSEFESRAQTRSLPWRAAAACDARQGSTRGIRIRLSPFGA